jgi:hypothetical protein
VSLYADLSQRTAATTLDRLRDAGIIERWTRIGAGSIGDPLLPRDLAALPGG